MIYKLTKIIGIIGVIMSIGAVGTMDVEQDVSNTTFVLMMVGALCMLLPMLCKKTYKATD